MKELYVVEPFTVEVAESLHPQWIDLNRIQVAPQNREKPVEFKTLSLVERQELLQRLIKRVKTL